jgi:acyl-CoA reductase-like NAD-dependent aldehyde dehydrogenase
VRLDNRDDDDRARGALVAKCGELLRAHVEELAQLTSLETGKVTYLRKI